MTTDSYRFAADRAQARETPAGERWRHGHRGCGRDRGGADHHLHGRLCVPRLVLPSQRLDDRPRTLHCREVQELVRARVDYVAPGVNRPASQQCRTAQPLGFHRGWVRCDTQWGGFGDPLLRRVCVAFSSSGPQWAGGVRLRGGTHRWVRRVPPCSRAQQEHETPDFFSHATSGRTAVQEAREYLGEAQMRMRGATCVPRCGAGAPLGSVCAQPRATCVGWGA